MTPFLLLSRLQAGTGRKRRQEKGLRGHKSLKEWAQLVPGVQWSAESSTPTTKWCNWALSHKRPGLSRLAETEPSPCPQSSQHRREGKIEKYWLNMPQCKRNQSPESLWGEVQHSSATQPRARLQLVRSWGGQVSAGGTGDLQLH